MSPRQVLLGDLIHIKHGFAFKGEFFSDSGKYILLTPGNCAESGGLKLKGDREKFYSGDFPSEFILSQGDLIVVMTDLVQAAPILGGAFLIPEDDRFLHNQRLGLVTLKDAKRLDKNYLYYALNHDPYRSQVRGSATGVTVRHTAPERIYHCTIPVPTLAEQKQIAGILSAYDDLIANNRRRIQLLERAARELYKEWFVRLRFPGHAHTRIVDGVPEGWERRKLGDIASLVMGQSPKSEHYNTDGEGLPFHQGVSSFGTRFVTHETYCRVSSRLAEPGDILFSVRAPVGRLNITLDRIIIGRGLAAIRTLSGHQSFLYYQLKNHFFKEDMIGGGAIFAAVTKKDLENQLLLCPDSQLIDEFEQIGEPIDKQLRVLFMENQRLAQARDLLLPRLMRGELFPPQPKP